MKIKSLILAVTVPLILSCGNERREDGITEYDLSESIETEPGDFFAGLEITPLRFEGKTYPNAVWKLDLMDGKIIIQDKSQLIHIFDNDGRYISCSESVRGEGPEEYSILTGYFINPGDQTIEVLSPTGMLTYDINFHPLGRHHLPTVIGKKGRMFQYGFAISDSICLLVPSGIAAEPHKFYIFNMAKEEIVNEADYASDIIAPISMQEHHFFKMKDDELLFSPPAYTGNIYQFSPSNGELKRVISLNYDDDTLTKSEIDRHNVNPETFAQYLLTSGKKIPVSTMVNDRYIVSIIKSGNQFKDLKTIITHRNNGKSISIDSHDGKNYFFPIIMNTDNQYLYGVVTKDFLISNPKLSEGFNIDDERALADIDEEDYVLLRYKLPSTKAVE